MWSHWVSKSSHDEFRGVTGWISPFNLSEIYDSLSFSLVLFKSLLRLHPLISTRPLVMGSESHVSEIAKILILESLLESIWCWLILLNRLFTSRCTSLIPLTHLKSLNVWMPNLLLSGLSILLKRVVSAYITFIVNVLLMGGYFADLVCQVLTLRGDVI